MEFVQFCTLERSLGKLHLYKLAAMQLCVVLAVVATLAAHEMVAPQPPTLVLLKLFAIVLVQIVVVLMARVIAVAVAAVDLNVESQQRQVEAWFRWHMSVWLVASIAVVSVLGWPQFVRYWVDVFLLDRVLLLLPIVAPLLMSWAVFYDAEGNEDSDDSADVPQSRSTRSGYVLAQARCFLLLPLLPLCLIVVFSDAVNCVFPEQSDAWWSGLIRLVPIVGILFAFPILLRMVWRTEPLPPGALRSRLEKLSAEVDFRAKDILVWRTNGRMSNAAISGILPGLRYVLLTDRLMEVLSPREIEMVFLHEVAHSKLRHSLKMMGGTVALACFVLLLANSLDSKLKESARRVGADSAPASFELGSGMPESPLLKTMVETPAIGSRTPASPMSATAATDSLSATVSASATVSSGRSIDVADFAQAGIGYGWNVNGLANSTVPKPSVEAGQNGNWLLLMPHVPLLGGLAILLASLSVVGRCARLFELQADLWATDHAWEGPELYLRAIATVSSGDPDRRTWLHPSFQQRCQFLLQGSDRAHAWLRRQTMFFGVIAFGLVVVGWCGSQLF